MHLHESNRSRARFDYVLVILVFGLAAFGVLSVSVATFSTSSEAEDTLFNYILNSYYGLRQALFFLISPIVVGFLMMVPYEFIHRNSKIIYVMACGLLALALGASKAAGVKAWIDMLWGYTIQPAEFVKLACIIVLARELENNTNPLSKFKDWVRIFTLMGIPWGLTLLQGETGSVFVMVFVFAIMMYFGGLSTKTIIIVLSLGAALLAVGYAIIMTTNISDYRITRILSFLDSSLVDDGASYQVDNSKIAIGSGGLYGKGTFVQGSFSQLDYVPEDWTDFIFSTIGEAFGFVGCAGVIIVYLLIILRMLYLARYTLNRFGSLVIIGVMAMLLFHVFENVGMTTGLMPVTGIPLPFVSYGGSNLVTNMAGIGLVLNVVKNRSSAYDSVTPQIATVKQWTNRKGRN